MPSTTGNMPVAGAPYRQQSLPPTGFVAWACRHDGWTVALVLIVLNFAAYPRVWLRGEVISPASILYWFAPWNGMIAPGAHLPANNVLSDEIDSTIPTTKYIRDCLLAGDVPSWCDKTQNGMPLYWVILHNMMLAPLLALVMILDVPWGLTIFAIGRQVIGGWFFYRYLRLFGLRQWACTAGTIIFTFGSFPMQTFGRPLSTQLALIPITLFAMERIVRDRGLLWTALLPVLLHFNIVSGFPAGTVYCFYFFVLYGLYRLASQPGRRLRLLATFLALGIVAVLISLPALAATRDYFSSFDWDYRAANWRSHMPWMTLPSFFVPYFTGTPVVPWSRPSPYFWSFDHCIYIGALPILVLFLWMFTPRPGGPGPRWFFLLFAAWMFVLLFDVGGILERVIQHVPVFNSSKNTRQKVLLYFVLAVLSALALHDLSEPRRRPLLYRRITWLILPLLAATGYGVWRYRSLAEPSTFVTAHLILQLPLLAASVILIVLLRRRAVNSLWLKAAVLVLLFVDLQVFDKSALGLGGPQDVEVTTRLSDCFNYRKATAWNPTIKRELFFPESNGIRFLRDNIGDAKMITLENAMLANTPLYFGLSNFSGRAFLTGREKEMYRLINENAFRQRATQFLFPINDETRLGSGFVDALGIKYVVLPPTRGIDELSRSLLVRQKEWNHVIDLVPGSSLRQDFIPNRDMIADTITLMLHEYALDDPRRLRLVIHDHAEGTNRAAESAEWVPDIGRMVYSIGTYPFKADAEYSLEFTLGADAKGQVRVRSTKDVDLLSNGQGYLNGAADFDDLTFSVFDDTQVRLDKFRLVHDGDLAIFENTAVFPRAWLVGGLKFSDDEETLAGLRQDLLDLRETAWASIEDQAAIGDPGHTGKVDGSVTAERVAGGRQRFRVEADHPCFLIVSDNYHPNWRASVDGRPATLFRADFNFRGVPVPAGAHTVELEYRTPCLRESLAMSLLAAAGFTTTIVLMGRRRNAAIAPPVAGRNPMD